MRDVLDNTNRTRRYKAASIIASNKTRSAVVVAGLANLIAAGGLAAINTATFGFLEAVAATDSVAIGAGGTALTCADNPWTAGDVGKVVHIAGAGPASAVLVSVITAFATAGSVTIADAATTAVVPTKTSAAGLAAWGWSAATRDTDTPIRDSSTVPFHADRTTATGATVARPVGEKLAEIALSIMDFGAKPGQDSTVAINAALAAVEAAGGGQVNIPVGTFLFSAPLRIGNRVRLVGKGWNSVLKANSLAVSAIASSDQAVTKQGILLQDFYLDNTALPIAGTSRGIDFQNVSHSDIVRVKCRYFDYGIVGQSVGAGVCYYNNVQHVFLNDCRYGIDLMDGANDWVLTQPKMITIAKTGIRCGGGNMVALAPSIEHASEWGVDLVDYGGGNAATFCHIYGGRYESNVALASGMRIAAACVNNNIFAPYIFPGAGGTYIDNSSPSTQFYGDEGYFPWVSTFVPVVASVNGAITAYAAACKYRLIGSIVFFEIKATITTKGTAAGSMEITLPKAKRAATTQSVAAAVESTTTGAMGVAFIAAATSTMTVKKADWTTPFVADGDVWEVSGWYEV